MTAMLASVASGAEAEIALALGADVVDLKDPTAGALGALPLPTVAAIVKEIAGRRPVSATVGDLPMIPNVVTSAAQRTAGTGVDFVKVGLFAQPGRRRCIAALSAAARSTRMVGVLFADEGMDLSLLDVLADAGFAAVMLDTAAKGSARLRHYLTDGELATFVSRARASGLATGLAGSLGLDDIPPLVALEPTYLGFRTALCRGGERTQRLDAHAFVAVRTRLAACRCAERPAVLAQA